MDKAKKLPFLRRRSNTDLHGNTNYNQRYQEVLRDLEQIRIDIRKNDKQSKELEKRLEDLEEQVKSVFENDQKKIEHLQDEVQDLKRKVEQLQAKNTELDASLALAQSTWDWEAHLARFVVDPAMEIFEGGRFRQMNEYLQAIKVEDHSWKEIQIKINNWTPSHWDVVKSVREERNRLAHPELIDLDLVEQEITKMSPNDQEKMRTMLDILKMTASLMKFGRLASKSDLSLKLNPNEQNVLKVIISWDRKFEEIGGLLNIEHEEAKLYLKMYVGERDAMIDHYVTIVDSILEKNLERLGKLARKFAQQNRKKASTSEESETLQELMKLLPRDSDGVTPLDQDIAKLHIPDFLPKRLWKDGIDIVENYQPPRKLPR